MFRCLYVILRESLIMYAKVSVLIKCKPLKIGYYKELID
jgi:hypothetical protein